MLQAEQDILVLAAQEGNQAAIDKLYRHHQKPLQRFAYKLCQDPEMAADALQDTWIKTARNIRRLKDPRAFKSWLYRMLRWRIVDLQRQQPNTESQIDNVELIADDFSVNEPESEFNELNAAIKALPATERQIIHLFYLDEMKMAEIAVIIEIPVGTVKSRLNRARKMLKQKFESHRRNRNEY